MNHEAQNNLNKKVINWLLSNSTSPNGFPRPYKQVCADLNLLGYRTTRGNIWTPKRLFRMLQRNGISGLWGIVTINKL